MKAQVYQVYPKGTEYTKYPRRLQNRAKTKYIPSVANEAPKETKYTKYPPNEALKGTKYNKYPQKERSVPLAAPKQSQNEVYQVYRMKPQKERSIPSIPGGSKTKPKRSIYQL